VVQRPRSPSPPERSSARSGSTDNGLLLSHSVRHRLGHFPAFISSPSSAGNSNSPSRTRPVLSRLASRRTEPCRLRPWRPRSTGRLVIHRSPAPPVHSYYCCEYAGSSIVWRYPYDPPRAGRTRPCGLTRRATAARRIRWTRAALLRLPRRGGGCRRSDSTQVQPRNATTHRERRSVAKPLFEINPCRAGYFSNLAAHSGLGESTQDALAVSPIRPLSHLSRYLAFQL
jgi:hypothetical protein